MLHRIAISTRVVCPQEYHDPRDTLSQDWHPFLAKCGLQALHVPNNVDVNQYLEGVDLAGVILSGGNNVHPNSYNNTSNDDMSDTSLDRDRTEAALIDWAIARNKPVVGVCRGMHMINVYFGGTILKDIQASLDKASSHVACIHDLKHLVHSFYGPYGDSPKQVNSYHNQGITKQELSDKLRCASVHAEDNVVEVLYHPDMKIVGIQWHPERPNPASEFDLALFSSLFSGENRQEQGEQT